MSGGRIAQISFYAFFLAYLSSCQSADLYNIGSADSETRNDIEELQERQADERENAIRIEERSRDIADGIGELIEQSQSAEGTDAEFEKLINEIREGNGDGTSDNREAEAEDSADGKPITKAKD
ncbi:MAG: hypothetical protein II811_07170 [Spirochaetaceae bacterium]|nr:hypothetical protein [Spirochaetaceae bacterium]